MKPLFSRLAGRHLDDAALAAIWTSMTAAGASVTSGASDPHLAVLRRVPRAIRRLRLVDGRDPRRRAARGGRDLHARAARGPAGA